jgi:deoxyribonuclease-4
MSIAGGYFKAIDAAAELGMETCQVFTKNNNQWRAKEIVDEDIDKFNAALKGSGVKHPLSHASYLINLAAPAKELWQKSIEAMVVELQRAEMLGIPFVVVHPGAFTTSSEEAGIKAIVKALDEIASQTKDLAAIPLLETTAGQGSCLGCKFEELATMLDGVKQPERVATCLDTCHIFAAGYPISSEKDYKQTMRQFNKLIGLKRLKAIHVNDSKKPLGSRVDRHAHIGHGEIGMEGFRQLMADRRMRKIPMYLETPKADNDGEPWDATNLRTLRELAAEAE